MLPIYIRGEAPPEALNEKSGRAVSLYDSVYLLLKSIARERVLFIGTPSVTLVQREHVLLGVFKCQMKSQSPETRWTRWTRNTSRKPNVSKENMFCSGVFAVAGIGRDCRLGFRIVPACEGGRIGRPNTHTHLKFSP